MLNIKKNHLGKRIISLVILACMAVPGVTVVEDFCAPVIAEAGHRNADEERLSGQRMLEEHRQGSSVKRAKKDSLEYRIQKTLVEANPDKLNFDDGKHERWVDPLYIQIDTCPNAWSNGSTIIMTTEEVRLCSIRLLDEEHPYRPFVIRKDPEANLGVTSDIASVLAHELAHFANKDTMLTGQSHKENIREELQADIDGMELMDKLPQYSPGSMAIVHMKERWYDYGPSPDYPSNYDATRNCLDYIEKMSGNKVAIDDYGRIKVNGALFMDDGTIHGTPEEGSRQERTIYLAGQIASCMKHKVWHKANFVSIDAHEIIPAIEKGTKTLVSIVTPTYMKYLGVFDCPYYYKPDSELTEHELYEKSVVNYIENMIPE